MAQISPVAKNVVDLGPAPSSATVKATLYLVPDSARAAALDQFLKDVQDSTSASYRKWVTPAQFGAKYGAADSAVADVKAFAGSAGLNIAEISASGMRVTLTGTSTQMEAAFAPSLHAYQVGQAKSIANTVTPSLPVTLSKSVVTVGGFDTVDADWVGQLGDAVEANTQRVVTVKGDACFSTVTDANHAAFIQEAKQAAAQGLTVLIANACGASFPSEVTAVVTAAVSADSPTEARPGWQWAPGLPDDSLRHSPDLMASDVMALQQTLLGIEAQLPAQTDGTPARLGNVNATLYSLAPVPNVFSQPDGAAAGTWEPATGLGLVNLQALAQAFPKGATAILVSGSATNYAPTHGQSTTLSSTVTDISGSGGTAVPTGTITFTLKDGTTLGTSTMSNGTATLTTNKLPGGTIQVIPSYSGDSTFSAGQGTGIYFAVQGEPAAITATVGGTVALGANSTVQVSVGSASGLGTPSGSVTVIPQGIGQNPPTYSATLSGTNGTATATVTVPALQAGAISLLINCVSADLSFTCYQPIHATAVVTQSSSSTKFTVTPTTPVSGTTTTFVATITGSAPSPAPSPTGSVGFYDNGSLLGTADLTSGKATYSSTTLSSSTTAVSKDGSAQPKATVHAFTASYFGDVNYAASNAAVPSAATLTATSTSVTVSPNPPVTGTATTFTATVAYTSTGTAATGTVQFYQDGTLLGTGTLSSTGVATLSSTTISGTAAHSFYAVYPGDTLYATSQSAAVTTQANTATVTTTTTVASSATTVNSGSTVTFTATVTPATSTGTAPTGTVSFTSSTQGLLGTATLTGTTASLATNLTTAGAQSISATYSGDTTYKTSASAAPATVTVGSVVTPISLSVTPATGAMYSNPVTATVSVAGVSTTTGTGPVGAVVFTITPLASTTAAGTATVALSPVTTTSGLAVYTFAAPAPGTYTVTAACTGTNFTCTTVTPSATLVTVKGATVTTVTATPAALVSGTATTLTATITPASASASSGVFTGTVQFYNQSGTLLGTGTVSGNQATATTSFASTTGNTVTAVYSGDTNWSMSTSAVLTLVPAVITTTTTLSANFVSALAGTNIIFTVKVTDAPSATFPTPPVPSGQVTFYDNYNGTTVLLGTAALSAAGPYTAQAQVSTTGLFHGLHTVTAYFAATTQFSASTSTAVVNITDYSVAVSPSSLTLSRGASGSAQLTLTALDGFAGTIALSCTPAPDTSTTCVVSPSTLGAGGTATVTVGTTAPRARTSQQAGLERVGLGVSMAALMGFLLLPKKRRPTLLSLLLLCGLIGAAGCGLGGTTGGTPVNPPTGGSPLGTYSFTIVTSGSDGISTNRHTAQLPVTIQ